MSVYEPSISKKEEKILSTLEDYGEMRVEEIADSTGLSYDEVRETLHNLSDKSLVSTGPGYGYEASRLESDYDADRKR